METEGFNLGRWLVEHLHYIIPTLTFILGCQAGTMFSRAALKKDRAGREKYDLLKTLRRIWEQHPPLREYIEHNEVYAEHYPVEKQYKSGRWKRFTEGDGPIDDYI